MTLIQEIEQEFGPKFAELTDRAGDINERIQHAQKDENSDAEAVKALTDELTEVGEKVASLTQERDSKLREVEFDSMKNTVASLEETLKAVRSDDRFQIGTPADQGQAGPYGKDSDHVFYADAYKALVKGDQEALGRWTEAVGEKAMTEGTGSAGGYLVPDQISSELLELKVAHTVLRGLFSSVQVNSDTLRISQVTGGLTAGWVAELATKPSADLTFGEISANVFTKAGLAVVSNQLLRDSVHSVPGLVNRDLAKRLAILEEIAFLNGSGTGQPQGILNTSGVQTTTLTSTAVLDLLDAIVTAITNIYTNYLGAPDAIVMHPRTWARIISARESATSENFLVGPPAGFSRRTPTDSLPGYGNGQLPLGSLFGLPVYCTPNMPVNLGAGTNESRVIVGRFDEGLILDNQGVTLDSSEHVYFTSNQTVFRAEDRVGFTAARYPKAFDVIQGAGLAAG